MKTIYEKVRKVPVEAQKTIQGGRLKGMTDINPMWRIKTLDEQFGMCGIGWKAPITARWIDEGANGEKIANVEINLYVKVDGEWSDGIQGIGGAMFIAKEREGLYTDDECFKKAYTDALSVACKALGMAADIYWQKDRTKYTPLHEFDDADKDIYAEAIPVVRTGEKRKKVEDNVSKLEKDLRENKVEQTTITPKALKEDDERMPWDEPEPDIDEAVLDDLWSTAQFCGFTEDTVYSLIQKHFKKTMPEELTLDEANKFIRMCKEYKESKGGKVA